MSKHWRILFAAEPSVVIQFVVLNQRTRSNLTVDPVHCKTTEIKT